MQGDFEEALARSKMGYSIDPNAFVTLKGLSHFFMNQHDEAMKMCRALLLAHTQDVFGAGRLFLYMKLYDDVIRVSEEWLKNNQTLRIPVALGNLAIACYHTNQKDRTELLLTELKQKSEKFPVGSPAYFLPWSMLRWEKLNLLSSGWRRPIRTTK